MQWSANSYNKSNVCGSDSKTYQMFAKPGQEHMLLNLVDNPLVALANVAGAANASFVFSREASENLSLPTVTEYFQRRIGPLVKVETPLTACHGGMGAWGQRAVWAVYSLCTSTLAVN